MQRSFQIFNITGQIADFEVVKVIPLDEMTVTRIVGIDKSNKFVYWTDGSKHDKGYLHT